MVESLVGGLLGLVVLGLGLLFLVALPFLLLGLLLRGVLFLLLLPFRLIGVLVGGVGLAFGALFKGTFAIVSVIGGLLLVALLFVLFPVGLLALAALAVWGLIKLVLPGAAVGAV